MEVETLPYRNKELGECQIRLLKLLEGKPEDALLGNLELFPFQYVPNHEDNKLRPSYEALSYYWGPKVRKDEAEVIRIIRPDGVFPIPLRHNLASALKCLRYPDRERWLWVDALCIFQKKHDPLAIREKNLQLPLMHEVYNRAKHVCVWLGASEGNDSRAMEFVSKMVNLEYFHKFMNSDGGEEELASLAELLQKPWWNRRWIVQEIAVARDATIFCGKDQLSWKDFAKAISLFASRYKEVNLMFRKSAKFGHNPDRLGDIREYSAHQLVYAANTFFRKSEDGEILDRLQSLEVVVSTLSTFEGYDPRDVIYAVIALSNDIKASTRHKSQFMIDEDREANFFGERLREVFPSTPTSPVKSSSNYDLTQSVTSDGRLQPPMTQRELNVRTIFKKANRNFLKPKTETITIQTEAEVFDVYKDFLEAAVQHSGSMDILCQPWAAEHPDLPSWIQCQLHAPFELRRNRSISRIKGDLFVGSPKSGGKIYNASGPRSTCIWRFEDRPRDGLRRALIVEGYVLDHIDDLCLPSMGSSLPVEWFKVWEKLDKKSKVSDAFWRTLVGDRDLEGRKLPPYYYELIYEYLRTLLKKARGTVDIREIVEDEETPREVKEFMQRAHAVVCMRRLMISKDGRRIGLVPCESKEKDKICILNGCSVPIILRKRLRSKRPQSEHRATETIPELPLQERPSPLKQPEKADTQHDDNDLAESLKDALSEKNAYSEPATSQMIDTTTTGTSPTTYRTVPDHRSVGATTVPRITVKTSSHPDASSHPLEPDSGPSPKRSAPMDNSADLSAIGSVHQAHVVGAHPETLAALEGNKPSTARRRSSHRRNSSIESFNLPERTPTADLPDYYYEFIGECYVHGVMDGEAPKMMKGRKREQFWLR